MIAHLDIDAFFAAVELPPGPPEEAARGLQAAVARELRLSVSLGVATCKVAAKIASGLGSDPQLRLF